MAYPTKFLPSAFASSGNVDEIPQSQAQSGSGQASWSLGFPPESELPIDEGGKPPRRTEMNGVLNTLSQHILWAQTGGAYKFNAESVYENPSVIHYNDNLWYCKANTRINEPVDGSQFWERILLKRDLDAFIQSLNQRLLDMVYPVGSVYMSYNNVSPASFLGGTWVSLGEGRVLVGAGSTYKVGIAGGSKERTLSVDNIPSHNHGASSGEVANHRHTITIADNGSHNHAVSITGVDGHTHDITVNNCSSHTHSCTTDTVANHTHGITVNNGGSHTPSLKTNGSAGAHSHANSTANSAGSHAHGHSDISWAGSHTHTRGTMNITGEIDAGHMGRYSAWSSGALSAPSGSCQGNDGHEGSNTKIVLNAANGWTGATSENGGHNHSFSIYNDGAHTHGLTITSDGGHTHSLAFNEVAAHAHSASSAGAGSHKHEFTSAANGVHNHTASSKVNGGHNHSISITGVGNHSHTATETEAGKHSHTITINNTGKGSAFNIEQPYLPVYMWRRTA